MLAVHLLALEQYALWDASRNGVTRRDRPDPLAVVGFAPFEVATRAHQGLENLAEMSAVQHDQTHAR